jgi:uncharacterized membrane protein
MNRLLHAVLLGLLGAGIVHIAVLMLVPQYSVRDAWTVLSTESNYYTFTRLDPPGRTPHIRSLDPLFDAAACRFDLGDGVVRISGSGTVPYWSISVYDRAGRNIFSFNDRSSSQGSVDFVVAMPVQMVDLRNAMPAAYDRSVFVEADIGEGIAVVRAFAPDSSWEPTVTDYLGSLQCTQGR